MAALISVLGSAVSGHVRNRSEDWWTGENSWWGKITGGGSDRSDNTGTTVRTPRPGDDDLNPLIYVAIAYLVFVN